MPNIEQIESFIQRSSRFLTESTIDGAGFGWETAGSGYMWEEGWTGMDALKGVIDQLKGNPQSSPYLLSLYLFTGEMRFSNGGLDFRGRFDPEFWEATRDGSRGYIPGTDKSNIRVGQEYYDGPFDAIVHDLLANNGKEAVVTSFVSEALSFGNSYEFALRFEEGFTELEGYGERDVLETFLEQVKREWSPGTREEIKSV